MFFLCAFPWERVAKAYNFVVWSKKWRTIHHNFCSVLGPEKDGGGGRSRPALTSTISAWWGAFLRGTTIWFASAHRLLRERAAISRRVSLRIILFFSPQRTSRQVTIARIVIILVFQIVISFNWAPLDLAHRIPNHHHHRKRKTLAQNCPRFLYFLLATLNSVLESNFCKSSCFLFFIFLSKIDSRPLVRFTDCNSHTHTHSHTFEQETHKKCLISSCFDRFYPPGKAAAPRPVLAFLTSKPSAFAFGNARDAAITRSRRRLFDDVSRWVYENRLILGSFPVYIYIYIIAPVCHFTVSPPSLSLVVDTV